MKPRSNTAKHAALRLAVAAAVTYCPAAVSAQTGAGATVTTEIAPASAAPRPGRGTSDLPESNVEATLAIIGTTILDVSDGSLVPDQTVLVRRDRILAVGPAKSLIPPESAAVIDASGKYLIPGLWDMHVHTTDPSYFALLVANGVTGIRDMGGGAHTATDGCESIRADRLLTWRSRIEAGDLIGPRVVLSGPAASGSGAPTSLAVRTASEARATVRSLRALGVDFVKVYEGIPLDAYLALAAAAREAGLPLAGHVPAGTVGLLDALKAGQRSIEHVRDEILLCFTDDPKELARFFADDGWSPDDVAWGRSTFARCPAVIEALRTNDVWFTPTLVVERAKVAVDDDSFVEDSRRASLPLSVRDAFAAYVRAKRQQSPAERASERLWWRTQQQLVRRMNRSGAKFLAGTDAACQGGLPGFSLHSELALLVEAGLSPLGALQSATLNPARYFAAEESSRLVAPAARADLLLLDANPLEEISNSRRIHAVVLGGKLLLRADLDRLLDGGGLEPGGK
jgi:imidazolonepropionase-like amidohydrolase